MLTGVQIYNVVGSLVMTLPVATPDQTVPYIVKDIEGLGPVKADISTAPYANQDGGAVQATRVGNRNIVMTIGYRPDYLSNQTVQSLRREMYSLFPPKGEVRLRFLSDDYAPVEIRGIVESQEPVLFTKDPEVQISILCTEPYFTALSPIVLSGFNQTPVYPSYYGTAESGFLFELFVNRPLTIVTLRNFLNADIVYNTPLLANDVLYISTVRGDKYVKRMRNGVVTTDLDGLQSGALSMILDSRTPEFYALVGGAATVPYRLTFTPKYVGI